MAGVIKEWKCNNCGFFESDIPVCITCGSDEVLRVFLTPPAFKGDKSKFVDDQIEHFAKQSSLSNFSNNLSTRHQKSDPSIWTALPKNGGKINFSGELANKVGGGVSIKELKPMMGGQYEAIKHKDDVK